MAEADRILCNAFAIANDEYVTMKHGHQRHELLSRAVMAYALRKKDAGASE